MCDLCTRICIHLYSVRRSFYRYNICTGSRVVIPVTKHTCIYAYARVCQKDSSIQYSMYSHVSECIYVWNTYSYVRMYVYVYMHVIVAQYFIHFMCRSLPRRLIKRHFGVAEYTRVKLLTACVHA